MKPLQAFMWTSSSLSLSPALWKDLSDAHPVLSSCQSPGIKTVSDTHCVPLCQYTGIKTVSDTHCVPLCQYTGIKTVSDTHCVPLCQYTGIKTVSDTHCVPLCQYTGIKTVSDTHCVPLCQYTGIKTVSDTHCVPFCQYTGIKTVSDTHCVPFCQYTGIKTVSDTHCVPLCQYTGIKTVSDIHPLPFSCQSPVHSLFKGYTVGKVLHRYCIFSPTLLSGDLHPWSWFWEGNFKKICVCSSARPHAHDYYFRSTNISYFWTLKWMNMWSNKYALIILLFDWLLDNTAVLW